MKNPSSRLYHVNQVLLFLLLLYRGRLKRFVLQLMHNKSEEKVSEASHIVEKTTNVASSYISGIFIVEKGNMLEVRGTLSFVGIITLRRFSL